METHFSPLLINGSIVSAAVLTFVLFTHFSSAPVAANSAEREPAPRWELKEIKPLL